MNISAASCHPHQCPQLCEHMACRHFNLLLCHCWVRQLKPPHSFLSPTASLSNVWAHSGVKSVALGTPTPLLTAFLMSPYSSIQPCLSSITAECISTHNQFPFPRFSLLWGRMTSLVFMSHSHVWWWEDDWARRLKLNYGEMIVSARSVHSPHTLSNVDLNIVFLRQ